MLRIPANLYLNMNKSEIERCQKNKLEIDKLKNMLRNIQENPEEQISLGSAVFYLFN